ncbi:MAG: glycosyl hydrolase [Thermomicrobiales bacterium]|nr:glycosyl hydrolase [Thermomicrobiales bacterium]
MNEALLNSLEWRLIGPFRGGRVPAVAGHPNETGTFYFGACAGGVWKTTNAGDYWENISDGYFNTAAVGAIALAPSDPNVIYVGMGETSIRGDVSHGDGVYKSTDGGQTWQHVGLADTHAISTIRVHPNDPDLVYVAALGHVWGPNAERGVYRSADGGATWEQILHVSPRAGAIDLAMDPHNPRVLYAAMWDAQRYPHALRSGGPDSSIYKTVDGGTTWENLTSNPGLPTGTLGKIGVAVSAKPGRVWALVEADDGALFRSENGGATWQRVCDNADLRRRAWYYMHIVADPQDGDTVYVLNLKFWKSIDGGRTFTAIPTQHGDNQDLWIDPNNPQRMIEGNDGGANVSLNGGKSWSTIYNQPTAQFYHVTTDERVPYRLYGSQQDNTALSVPSSSIRGAITETEYFEPGGGESGYIAIKPDDNNIVYGGAIGSGAGNGRLLRFDQRTMETRIVTPWPEVQGMGRGAGTMKYRFQWTFPIVFSPHDPNTLYATSNVVHRTRDEGMSWEVISPDLSHNDPETLVASGGPITRDNTGAEAYGTIFAFIESPHEPGVYWAGSDDGRVHISRDGGESWDDVSIPASLLPDRPMISVIEPSPHDQSTVYIAATRYKHDDFAPYLYKTTDDGATWTKITNGIPDTDFTRVIREDPNCRGLLYAGTETGVYVSFDDGANWQRFNANLPIVPVYDLMIKGTDLLAATHGRSFWILDDLSPLHQMDATTADQPATLFAPRVTKRIKVLGRLGDPSPETYSYGRAGGMAMTTRQRPNALGGTDVQFFDAGKNPPDGAIIHYWLKGSPKSVTLTIKDSDGNAIRHFSSDGSAAEGLPAEALKVSVADGANRFVWDLRVPGAAPISGIDPTFTSGLNRDSLVGPVVAPGSYSVDLTVDGTTYSQPLTIEADPRVTGNQADLEAQFDLLIKIRDKINETHAAVDRIHSIRGQVRQATSRVADDAASAAGEQILERLAPIEESLAQPRATDPRQFPNGLNDKLAALPGMISNADTRPPKQYYDVYEKLSVEVDEQLKALNDVIDSDVATFNQMLAGKIAAVTVS